MAKMIVKQYQTYVASYLVEIEDGVASQHAAAISQVLDGSATELEAELRYHCVDESRGLSAVFLHEDDLAELRDLGYYHDEEDYVVSIHSVLHSHQTQNGEGQ